MILLTIFENLITSNPYGQIVNSNLILDYEATYLVVAYHLKVFLYDFTVEFLFFYFIFKFVIAQSKFATQYDFTFPL